MENDAPKKPSLFSEYSKLILRGLKDADKVVAANWNKALDNYNLLDPVKKEIADKRLAICTSCPFNSVNAKTSPEFKALYNGPYYTNRSDEDIHCSMCGCPLEKKVLAMLENCGLELYNYQHPENPQELKWTAENL